MRKNDSDEIKQQAEETIGLLNTVMRKRGERQQTSVDPLCQVHNRATFDEQIDRVAIYPGDEDEATDLSARSPRGKKNTLRRCRTGLASGPPSLEVSDDSVAYARP